MVSPFIFGAIILIMFSFATGEIEKSMKVKLFTAELLLTTLFSLSIYFIRAFESEYEDKFYSTKVNGCQQVCLVYKQIRSF